jgi:hypothetical protein
MRFVNRLTLAVFDKNFIALNAAKKARAFQRFMAWGTSPSIRQGDFFLLERSRFGREDLRFPGFFLTCFFFGFTG